MIRKILKSKHAEGYIDVIVGVVALVMFIIIALNIFTFVTLKTTIDRIADDLIDTATFSGAFGDDFNNKAEQLKSKYFNFEIDVYAEKYFNEEHSRVQLGDDMGVTIRVNSAVAGIGIALPIDLAVSRIGQSEQHWQIAAGSYEKPKEDTSGKATFVLNTRAFIFHTPSCSTLISLSPSYRKDILATAKELIALNYSPCNVCDPHDCTTESALYYNANGHWGNCKFCGEEGPLEPHLFVYSLSDQYSHCKYCNAIKLQNGTICCRGGMPLTSETHIMDCNCDNAPPTISVKNLSTDKNSPTVLAPGRLRIEGLVSDIKGEIAKITVNGEEAIKNNDNSWYYDYEYDGTEAVTEISIIAIDDEQMETTLKCYVKPKKKSDLLDSEQFKVGYIHAAGREASFEHISTIKSLDADVLIFTELDVEAKEVLCQALDYTFIYWSENHLMLSRLPITRSEEVGASDVIHVVLDADGLKVDLYAGQFNSAAAGELIQAFSPMGEHWFIIGNMDQIVADESELQAALGLSAAPVKANLAGDIYEMYANNGTIIKNIASAEGGYIFDLVLSRAPLCDDLEVGSFDAIPSVGYWWVNYRSDNLIKEQVIRWLLKNKHEIVGLVHVPSDVLSAEGAALLAELTGYEYYSYEIAWTVDGVPTVGHMLLSCYPIEPQSPIILREDGQSSEGRRYAHAVVDIPDVGMVDFYYGENDSIGTTSVNQRATLEAAVKAVANESGRPFVIIGYNEGHVTNSYAGKSVNVYNNSGGVIIVSNPLPMSGKESYGTIRYPIGGKSPIKISIPNVDPYHKIDLYAIPEYQLTVTAGHGTGSYPAGTEVIIKADAPDKGKTFDRWVAMGGDGITFTDVNAADTSFIMPAGSVLVEAIYKDAPIVEKIPTGETKNLKVAVMPAFRFGGKYANYSQTILDNLLALTGKDSWRANGGADILILPLMDYDKTCGYNTSVDMFATLKLAFADEYPVAHFSRNWLKGTANDSDPNAGYLGHMIFSKYEMVDEEIIILNTENNGQGEVRSVGRVTVRVPGTGDSYADIDLFFGHLGAASNWTSGESNLYEEIKWSTADAWMVLGSAYASMGKSVLESELKQEVKSAFDFSRIDIVGSGNLSFNGSDKDATINNLLGNPDEIHFTTVTVPIYEAEAKIKYAVNVNGTTLGYYEVDDPITLEASDPGLGSDFANWILPQSVVLTGGTAATDSVIKFNMPAATLNLTITYKNVETYFVTVNGVLLGEYEAGDPIKAVAPASAVGKLFSGWTGLDRVGLKQGYTSKYATIEFAMPERNVDLIANYTDVDTSAIIPTYVAPGSNIEDITFAYRWFHGSKTFADVNNSVAADKSKDIAIGLGAALTEAQVAEIAAANGYDYYITAKAVDGLRQINYLMSKYPIVHRDTLSYSPGTGRNRSFCWIELNVNGTTANIIFGENNGGSGLGDKENYEPWIRSIVTNSSNPSIVIGYSLKDATILARLTASSRIGDGQILFSSGVSYMENTNSTNYVTGTLNIAKKDTYRFASMWTRNNGNNATVRAELIAGVKRENPDFIVLCGVNPNAVFAAGSVEAEVAAYGYPYFSFVKKTSTSSYGSLLMSKYPITELPVITSGGANFGHVQATMGGETVDIYFGADPNAGNTGNMDISALVTTILDNYNSTGNEFILAGSYIQNEFYESFQNKAVGNKRKPYFIADDGREVIMTRAFWGDSIVVYGSDGFAFEDTGVYETDILSADSSHVGNWMVRTDMKLS